MLRKQHIEQLSDRDFDVLVIGAGINGAASAAALSARGVRVALIDSRDFAGFTSQQSSNLVWGGIKYMENYEFGLVSGLCRSRNELMRSFPSSVQEIRFLTTVSKGFRHHPIMLWLGAWLYWFLGRGFTRTPKYLSVSHIRRQEPGVNVTDSPGGIEYSDAYLHDNDARFVFNFVRDAMDQGCVAVNYMESLGAERQPDGTWVTQARDGESGRELEIRSRILVNATGAFVDDHNLVTGIETGYRHILSRGVHLIVPRVNREERVLAFFASDGRLFFAIPMANRTCIGTTDTRVDDPSTEVTEFDRDYVLSNINQRLNLAQPITRDDIIAERCGVRPLAVKKEDTVGDSGDFLQLSRKHVMEVSGDECHVSIFGGKLTDCVNVGNEVCNRVSEMGITLTETTAKWYGEPSEEVFNAYRYRALQLGLDDDIAIDTKESLTTRLWRRYGSRAQDILDMIEHNPYSATPIVPGMGLRRCEIEHMANNEMIVNLEDLLRRRSKLGMLIPRDELRSSPALFEVCKTLFGDRAPEKLKAYFGEQ